MLLLTVCLLTSSVHHHQINVYTHCSMKIIIYVLMYTHSHKLYTHHKVLHDLCSLVCLRHFTGVIHSFSLKINTILIH